MRKSIINLVLFALAAAVDLGSSASAGLIPVTVNNASFEFTTATGNTVQPSTTPGAAPGWTEDTSGGGGAYVVNNNTGVTTATAGIYVQGTGDGSGADAVYQDVGMLRPNTTYLLSVDLINRSGDGGTISLVKGMNDLGMSLGTLTVPTLTGNLADQTVTITTGASVSGDFTIVLSHVGTLASYFDNVQLSIVTPEPSSIVLLGLGAVGMAWVARRRRA